MKIDVNCALQQPKVIELLETLGDPDISYKYEKTTGIKISFDVETAMSPDAAAAFTKSTIKASEFGGALFFNVVAK